MKMSEVTTESLPTVRAAPLWSTLVATFFGAGRLRPGPGTWGSAAAVLIWAAVARSTAVEFQWRVLIGLALLAIAVGIPAATRFARAARLKDPQSVVIDEVAVKRREISDELRRE